MEPIAYLGLEIKQRELDSRLLIASHLLDAGVSVLFGQQWAIFANADTLPPGVVLFKTVNRIQAMNMKNYRDHGHLVAATDEEVLASTDKAGFLEVFSEIAAENCDLFFAQNEVHKSIVEHRFPTLKGKTKAVGNARVDLLAGERRSELVSAADQLRNEHGPYVLFNTNYGQINSIWSDLGSVVSIASAAGLFNRDDPASVAEYKGKLDWERKIRDELVQLLSWTVENVEGRKIVLRPHPAEDLGFWKDKFGDARNLHIVPRSNPHPWILGADLVVHTSCTTGLEAALLDKPVINLAPISHPSFVSATEKVNPTFPSWTSAAEAMERFLASGDGPVVENSAEHYDALARQFANFESGHAAANIARAMVDLLTDYGAPPPSTGMPQIRGGGFKQLNRSERQKDKFQLSSDELVERLQAALRSIGRNIHVDLVDVDDSLFLLMPK